MSPEYTLQAHPAPDAQASHPARTAGIIGVGVALPERRVHNDEIAGRLGVSSEWIERRTGILERRYAAPGQRVSELASAAARIALQDAGLEVGEIDMVLVATLASDELTPSSAPIVARELGMVDVAAIDVGAACTGAIAALSHATAWIESGRARNVLVIGAEILTRFVDFDDPRTAPLFADGAGAAVLTATESADERVGPVVLRADHSGAHLIRLARGDRIRMDGRETYRAGVNALAEVTSEALAASHCRLEDIDLFVYHQANSRIIHAVGQRLGLPPERVVDYVDRFANASTATLPIALTVAESEGRIQPHDRVLLAAFGGGLTWGATVVRWSARASRPAPAPASAQPSVTPIV